METKGKKIALGFSILVVIGLVGLTASERRSPTLADILPIDGMSVQAKDVAVSGNVSPTGAVVTINGATVSRDGRHFSYNLPLSAEKNPVSIIATNAGRSVRETLTVTRIFTAQEKADIAATEAKAKADELAYEKTPGGKLCKTLTAWGKMNARADTHATRDDCDRAARGDVWIGMNEFILFALRGDPNEDNPSNYGNGTQYQYCWYDMKPECVYTKPGSDLITSYN